MSLEKMKALSLGKKIGLGFLSLCIVAAIAGPSEQSNTANNANSKEVAQTQPQTEIKLSEEKPVDTIETKTETTTEVIPFESTTQNDSTLASGTTKVSTYGTNGQRTLKYKVTYTNGKETGREAVSNEVTLEPVTQVTKVGTKKAVTPTPAASSCHSSYTGKCVPIASDVDCAGGSGNGPAYVSGPVTVIGPDVYDLDRDGNGLGCE